MTSASTRRGSRLPPSRQQSPVDGRGGELMRKVRVTDLFFGGQFLAPRKIFAGHAILRDLHGFFSPKN
jgi:hypothetical protein